MRKARILLATVAATAVLGVAAPPASACAGNPSCERINEVCWLALRTYCLR